MLVSEILVFRGIMLSTFIVILDILSEHQVYLSGFWGRGEVMGREGYEQRKGEERRWWRSPLTSCSGHPGGSHTRYNWVALF